MHCLSDYDVKVLLALNESIKGKEEFARFLMDNGFPEMYMHKLPKNAKQN